MLIKLVDPFWFGLSTLILGAQNGLSKRNAGTEILPWLKSLLRHEEGTAVTSPAWCHSKAMSLWPKTCTWGCTRFMPQRVSQGEFWTRPFTSHFPRATFWCGRAPGRFKTSRLLGAAKSQAKAKGAERRKDLVGLSKCPQHPAQPAPHPHPRASLSALGRDQLSAPPQASLAVPLYQQHCLEPPAPLTQV